jgi:DNA replication protein DnaC
MERLGATKQFRAMSQQGPSEEWRTETRTCSECQKPFPAKIMSVKGVDRYAVARCDSCFEAASLKEQREEAIRKLANEALAQRVKWRVECNLPPKLRGKTFDNFEVSRQPKAYKLMSTYDCKAGKSVVLWSPKDNVLAKGSDAYGLGKSHLCGALVNKVVESETTAWLVKDFWIQRRRCPVYYVTETAMIDRIKASFDKDAVESTDLIYKALTTVDLLIIDDVGKDPPPDYRFINSVYFRLIDGRDMNQRPIILTTNLKLDPDFETHIGGPSADRLREMCKSWVLMTGKSYRRKG